MINHKQCLYADAEGFRCSLWDAGHVVHRVFTAEDGVRRQVMEQELDMNGAEIPVEHTGGPETWQQPPEDAPAGEPEGWPPPDVAEAAQRFVDAATDAFRRVVVPRLEEAAKALEALAQVQPDAPAGPKKKGRKDAKYKRH